MKEKTYWIDADVDGTPKIGLWGGATKDEAKQKLVDYYTGQGVVLRDIIIRQVKVQK